MVRLFSGGDLTIQPQEYHTHAGSELLSSVENVTSNLPEHNHGQAVKLIQDSLKDNLKISEVINLIHNEALQDLPNIRQRFFIRSTPGCVVERSFIEDI